MNKNSNLYTFLYSVIMVVVVASTLAVVASLLKPFQKENIRVDKMLNILKSVGKAKDLDVVDNRAEYIKSEYDKYIRKTYVVNFSGHIVTGEDAFSLDLATEMKKSDLSTIMLPIFECSEDDGSKVYILPLTGKGLWGPIWGYIAVKQDLNTIAGVVFDHKGETPGLGADIVLPKFCEPFKNKLIFEQNNLVSISIEKPGTVAANSHNVDGISGGTITSKGVETMLKTVLDAYQPFIKGEMIRYQQSLQPVVDTVVVEPEIPVVPRRVRVDTTIRNNTVPVKVTEPTPTTEQTPPPAETPKETPNEVKAEQPATVQTNSQE